jgi:multiple sugar transport system permease protein
MTQLSGKNRQRLKKRAVGFLYQVPVLVGLLCFTFIPMILSLWYSLHDYNEYTFQLTDFGLQNYKEIFSARGWTGIYGVGRSLFLTFRYAIVSIAFNMVGSYLLALFLNQKLKGIEAFRVIYYLPCLIPSVAGALLWTDILNVNYGYLNTILRLVGLKGLPFYSKPSSVFPTLILTGVTGFGGNMIMWLAQMKNVPTELYEVADLDGASYWQKTLRITIPMTTSMIFYMLITGIIGSLQAYSGIYPLRTANPAARDELFFIVVKIYESYRVEANYAYACALSWFLFLIIGLLTTFVFKTSKWVYYGEEA